MKFNDKYKVIAEAAITRYQNGGLLAGDVVKIRKDAFKNEKVTGMLDNYKAQIKNAMETDLNLRVSCVKSIRANSTGNYSGGTDAPTDYHVDIYVEYAPGLWRDAMTVPMEILERIDTGINMAPIPDSLKRPTVVQGATELKTNDKDRTNAKKDTKMANITPPKDGRDGIEKPTEDKKDYTGKPHQLNKESLESLYGDMILLK